MGSPVVNASDCRTSTRWRMLHRAAIPGHAATSAVPCRRAISGTIPVQSSSASSNGHSPGYIRRLPLNESAFAVLGRQVGEHDTRVFTVSGMLVARVNTRAWKEALGRAGVADFCFHDLRHTSASWHVQTETPVCELQEWGAGDFRMWSESTPTRRLGNLVKATARIEAIDTNVATEEKERAVTA